MKKIFIFLILIVFSFCHLDEAKKEEFRKRRREEMKYLADCLLKNEKTSEALKQAIKDSPEDDIIRALHPHGHKLDQSDEDIIRECRRESIKARHEEFRRAEHIKMHERRSSGRMTMSVAALRIGCVRSTQAPVSHSAGRRD